MTVLLVDTSLQLMQRLEEILLEKPGIRTLLKATTREEAATFLDNNKMDIVLLDCGLTGNGTMDLLKKIKDSSPGTAVIILSNWNNYFPKMEFISNGADFILDKFYEFEKMPAIIHQIFISKNGHQVK